MGICPLLALSTFTSGTNPRLHPIVFCLLGLLAFALLSCTLRRRHRLSWTILLIHSGCLIILFGGLISAAGYVATVNIYEGESSSSAFRWDSNSEIMFDFALRVNTITPEFYPTAVKIGVYKKGEPLTLIQTQTGNSFQVEDCTITVKSLSPSNRSLSLEIQGPDATITQYQTSPAQSAQPSSTPLGFTLVAFKTPFVKQTWADLTILSRNQPVLSQRISVNNPATWNGLRFFLTATNSDSSGSPYAGIQIVKDQGTPISFTGFAVTCLGLLLLLGKKRQTPRNPS